MNSAVNFWFVVCKIQNLVGEKNKTRVRTQHQIKDQTYKINIWIYLLRCTFADSMHFTITVKISQSSSLIGWIEWKEVNLLNTSTCLSITIFRREINWNQLKETYQLCVYFQSGLLVWNQDPCWDHVEGCHHQVYMTAFPWSAVLYLLSTPAYFSLISKKIS